MAAGLAGSKAHSGFLKKVFLSQPKNTFEIRNFSIFKNFSKTNKLIITNITFIYVKLDTLWRYDTQQNNIKHNDTQHNDTQHNDTQHSGHLV
jgi:hypothetical protein